MQRRRPAEGEHVYCCHGAENLLRKHFTDLWARMMISEVQTVEYEFDFWIWLGYTSNILITSAVRTDTKANDRSDSRTPMI